MSENKPDSVSSGDQPEAPAQTPPPSADYVGTDPEYPAQAEAGDPQQGQSYPQQGYPAAPGQPYPQQGYPQPGQPYQQPGQPYQQPGYPAAGQAYPQPGYGPGPYAQGPYGQPYVEQKSRLVAGLLGIFLGGLGIHRFYLGHIGLGVVQLVLSLVTFGFAALWGFIEGIMVLCGAQAFRADARGVPLKE